MRSLKFRAWEIEDKKYYPVIKLWFDSTVGKPDSAELWLSQNETEIADIPEQIELEQCTGLKDKNGKEIYEGDIVKIARSYGYGFLPKGAKAKIEFDEKELCYKLRGQGEFRLTAKKELEVIGNIHENPELLEDRDGRAGH